MGLFSRPLLPAHFDNDDVRINPLLCPNIAIIVVGLARGEITILSGNDDTVHIRTSVQAKESIIRNAAELEPIHYGNTYTYNIHTPLEHKLEKSVTFQVFVTIPKTLQSLESLTIQGKNLELSVGNISHTFVRNLSVSCHRGDTTIENFYGDSVSIKTAVAGDICGKYMVANLSSQTKAGKIISNVRLLNTIDSQPSPRVLCSTYNSPVNILVDGTKLIGPFTVEAKTQCQPLDAKILLPDDEQCLRGNFINFGGPTRVKLSRNYQGRIESRTHYGKITLDEPEFKKIDGAMLSIPSPSDRNALTCMSTPHLLSPSTFLTSPSVLSLHQSSGLSSSVIETPSWDRDDSRHHRHRHHHHHHHRHQSSQHSGHNTMLLGSSPVSAVVSEASSRANSIHDSMAETRSIRSITSEKGRKKKKRGAEEESTITREVIGTIGHGNGLVLVKNSSGDIAVSLVSS
ncbi:hypothetical protein B0O80DRAFT_483348 [Mortierella sp. GBAus27b]|nr:hypothetical protein BGX31_002911 [Mortierella sp. GBA43]KAI8360984.1 hypothetical protein B0O80DRAFT_483348 [Mortierella sp. GBAus27b]